MSEQTPTISIIMPIYKVAQYLRRCLGSIKEQTYTDFEVLMIDDGSMVHRMNQVLFVSNISKMIRVSITIVKKMVGQLQHVITDYQ